MAEEKNPVRKYNPGWKSIERVNLERHLARERRERDAKAENDDRFKGDQKVAT